MCVFECMCVCVCVRANVCVYACVCRGTDKRHLFPCNSGTTSRQTCKYILTHAHARTRTRTHTHNSHLSATAPETGILSIYMVYTHSSKHAYIAIMPSITTTTTCPRGRHRQAMVTKIQAPSVLSTVRTKAHACATALLTLSMPTKAAPY